MMNSELAPARAHSRDPGTPVFFTDEDCYPSDTVNHDAAPLHTRGQFQVPRCSLTRRRLQCHADCATSSQANIALMLCSSQHRRPMQPNQPRQHAQPALQGHTRQGPQRDRVRKMPSPTSTGVVHTNLAATRFHGGKRIPVMLMSTWFAYILIGSYFSSHLNPLETIEVNFSLYTSSSFQ